MTKQLLARRFNRCLLNLGILSVSVTAFAQVMEPTAEDLSKVPAAFRGEGGPAGFAARGTPEGYTPNPDLKDFTGSYVSGGGGGPGGPGGPPGGAPGGGPGGFPGGGPGGFAGGAPGGAAPPGAGGPPGGAPGFAGGESVGDANREACRPSFGGGAYATHLVSSPGRLTVIGEENHRLRRIVIGGTHPANVEPSYAADSIAHWENNTLVVDTIAIKGREGDHLLERWTKNEDGSISIETSNLGEDGQVLSASNSTMVWRPDITYVENICEDFGEAFGEEYRKKLSATQ